MTLNVDFTPQSEAWIKAEAHKRGVPPAEVIRSVIEERAAEDSGSRNSPANVTAKNAAAIAMFDKWIAEDATDDPEELRKADQEVEELMQSLNRNRVESGERSLFP